jgi:hypothetical protein
VGIKRRRNRSKRTEEKNCSTSEPKIFISLPLACLYAQFIALESAANGSEK